MKPRIIYNDDSCTLRVAPQPHTLESLGKALDYLKGTQVDCLCWCLGEQVAYSWPSRVIENMFDLQANGISLHTGWDTGTDVMFSLYQQGIDYLPHLIERARAQGLTFIGSFRMNDTHLKSYPNSALTPEFWKLHQEYRLWEVTDGKSYYNAALDYSYPEVRNRYRDAIIEVLDNYDVDGIELDFSRNPYLFQPSEAWKKRTILTGFVREIRDAVNRAAERRKRDLILIVRIPCQQRALKAGGIDIKSWVRDKLPHILVITPLSNDYDLDLRPWLRLCQETGVLLYPSVEAGVAFNNADFYTTQVRNPIAPRHDNSGTPGRELEEDLRLQRAAAQNYLAQKPDGIYMFNFPCRLAEGENLLHTDPQRFSLITSVLHEMGDLETLHGRDKTYTFYPQLPIYIEAGRPRRYHQTVSFSIRGEDIKNGNVTIRFRQVAERSPHADGDFQQNSIVQPGLLTYFLNDHEVPEESLGKTPAPAGLLRSGFTLPDHELIELKVSGKELKNGANTLGFEMPHFPQDDDPYVYIYELEVDVRFP